MAKIKKHNVHDLTWPGQALKNRKLTEKTHKLEKDLKHSQQLNGNLSKGNVYLRVKLKNVTSYFMQAVVVLEDIADRFDIVEGDVGFDWAGELKKDIEHVLQLENKLSEELKIDERQS